MLDADRLEDPDQLDLGQVRFRLVQAGPQHQMLVRHDERDAHVRVAPCQRRARRAPHGRKTASDDHKMSHCLVLSASPPGDRGVQQGVKMAGSNVSEVGQLLGVPSLLNAMLRPSAISTVSSQTNSPPR